jgi:uncharacterized protein YoaH (UPF0181 family)
MLRHTIQDLVDDLSYEVSDIIEDGPTAYVASVVDEFLGEVEPYATAEEIASFATAVRADMYAWLTSVADDLDETDMQEAVELRAIHRLLSAGSSSTAELIAVAEHLASLGDETRLADEVEFRLCRKLIAERGMFNSLSL